MQQQYKQQQDGRAHNTICIHGY